MIRKTESNRVAYEVKHPYLDFLIVWDNKKLLYTIVKAKQKGSLPKVLKGTHYTDYVQAKLAIDRYLTSAPSRKKVAVKEA